MKINKKIYFLILVWFAVLLLSSTSVITFLLGDIKKTDINSYNAATPTRGAIDKLVDLGGIKEIAHLRGWVFSENALPNENKAISILLVGSKGQFEVKTNVGHRQDVFNAFKDVCDTYGINHGFAIEFSTIGIPSGEYELYGYCCENESAQGIVHLGYKMIKNARKLSFVASNNTDSIEPELIEINDPTALVDAYLDVLVQDESGDIRIEGWAFCETEGDNSGKVINILLRSAQGDERQYYAAGYSRSDVYDAFKDSKRIVGDHHGFTCVIPASELAEGTYDVYVLCQETETEYGMAALNRQIVVGAQGITLLEQPAG